MSSMRRRRLLVPPILLREHEMKAFAIDAYKSELSLRNVPDPVAGPGQVVVAIAAASVNPIDVKLREGEFKAILPHAMPFILGSDLAGTVVAVGPGANRFQIGDAVFASPNKDRIGTFAERIAIDEADLALKPPRLSMVEAAALPLVALTAWQVLVERAKLKPGQKILIHAGSGGVGTVAIQLAKQLGATVATTAGTDNLALVKSLGADIVVDYRKEDFAEKLSGYDVVLNTLGGDVLEKSLAVLKPGGKLISISGPPDLAFARSIGANAIVQLLMRLLSFKIRRKASKRDVSYSFLFMHSDGEQLAQIAKLVEEGTIRPVIDSVFSFAETPAAMARVASGRARGKVVIAVTEVLTPDPGADGA
ncbi:NADPH:quinone reductase-like Zn-dependent oxidoreductase [Sphingopyxis sp. BE259]|nr:NADPH:quinone reductase-like Zn-dependent oxidoreductase [Sphingopyxis sp. BE259]